MGIRVIDFFFGFGAERSRHFLERSRHFWSGAERSGADIFFYVGAERSGAGNFFLCRSGVEQTFFFGVGAERSGAVIFLGELERSGAPIFSSSLERSGAEPEPNLHHWFNHINRYY